MTQPTFVAYTESSYSDTSGTETTGSLTWVNGDKVYVLGGTGDNAHTLGTPTTAGSNMGAFSLVASTSGASTARTYYWKATATGSGSGTITSTADHGGAGDDIHGLSVWQYRDVSGEGTAQTINGSSAKTISVTRGAANSHILEILVDWNEVGDVVTDPTPATNATERETTAVSTQADFFVTDWGDQGSTGTTAYGITNHTGTVKMSGIAIEIKGVAADITLALTGASATGQAGTLTPSSTLALSGVSATGQTGTLIEGDAEALTGVSATGQTGTLVPNLTIALSGVSATGQTGALGPAGDLTLALTGVSATGAAGTLVPDIGISLAGSSGSSALGALSPQTSVALLGAASTGATGILTALAGGDITVALTGVEATGQTGQLIASGADAQANFSGGFLYEYERSQALRARRRREREEREAEAQRIADETAREIAQLLHEQEAQDEERADLDRLRELARLHRQEQATELTERVRRAFARVLLQENRSALEALDRELQRQLEEEEIAALMLLLNDE